ncbi:MAG: glycosyltransferase [Chloroflexi bacterium]|nr:MAG: glycosyltransferase [Chloroflexota bacterium]
MSYLVSVVIATYHRPNLLKRCLEALIGQNINPTLFEIIVVDDGADPETEHVVEEVSNQAVAYQLVSPMVFTGQNDVLQTSEQIEAGTFTSVTGLPRIHYFAAPPGKTGPGAARNEGWKAAQGKIIAFTDDDCLPEPDWLEKGTAKILEGAAGASGKVIVPLPDQPTDSERNMRGLEYSEFVTANCFYRRDVLEETGGFDERFQIAWREDSDLYFSVLERGYRLVQAPDAVVVHPSRKAPWGYSLREQRKNYYSALLYKKHPQAYQSKLQNHAPKAYYMSTLALLSAGIGGIMGNLPVGISSLSLWTGLTLAFTVRRLQGNSRSLRHKLEMLVTSAFIPLLALFWRTVGSIRFRTWFF